MSQTTPVYSPDLARKFYEKIFGEKDLASVPIVFSMEVLERYTQEPGHSLIRTRSAGRVQAPSWRVDFGILDAEGLIHAPAGEVMKLPAAERQHWAQFALANVLNARFLRMRLGLGACIDEGDIETWDGRPKPAE